MDGMNIERQAGLDLSLLRVRQLLGRGGFASCWRATYGGQDIALKILSPQQRILAANVASKSLEEDLFERMFLREAQIMIQLEHRHIVRCYGVVQLPAGFLANQRAPALAMSLELCEPYTVKDLITRSMAAGRRLFKINQSYEWLVQVASALAYLHGQKLPILHRDVKPENILLKRETGLSKDGKLVCKLSDFGLHVEVAANRLAMLRRSSKSVLRAGNGGASPPASRPSSIASGGHLHAAVAAAAAQALLAPTVRADGEGALTADGSGRSGGRPPAPRNAAHRLLMDGAGGGSGSGSPFFKVSSGLSFTLTQHAASCASQSSTGGLAESGPSFTRGRRVLVQEANRETLEAQPPSASRPNGRPYGSLDASGPHSSQQIPNRVSGSPAVSIPAPVADAPPSAQGLAAMSGGSPSRSAVDEAAFGPAIRWHTSMDQDPPPQLTKVPPKPKPSPLRAIDCGGGCRNGVVGPPEGLVAAEECEGVLADAANAAAAAVAPPLRLAVSSAQQLSAPCRSVQEPLWQQTAAAGVAQDAEATAWVGAAGVAGAARTTAPTAGPNATATASPDAAATADQVSDVSVAERIGMQPGAAQKGNDRGGGGRGSSATGQLADGCSSKASNTQEGGDQTMFECSDRRAKSPTGASATLSGLLIHHPDLVEPVFDANPAVGLRDMGSLMRQLGLSELKPLRRHEMEWVFGLTGMAGSFMYMAPEVFRKEPYNEKSDVFSFGMLLYELLACELLIVSIFNTGRAAKLRVREPHDYAELVARGYRPPRIQKLPDAAWALIEACWHQDPVQRPAMSEVLVELERMVDELNLEGARHKSRSGRPVASGGSSAAAAAVVAAPGRIASNGGDTAAKTALATVSVSTSKAAARVRVDGGVAAAGCVQCVVS